MSEIHHHSHHSHNTEIIEKSKGKLALTVFLNLIITISQIIGGIVSGSLSLISDALHNLSDAVAIIVSYIAIVLTQKKRTNRHTFGLKRAEIISAVFNSATLVAIAFYLFYEAAFSFIYPKEIKGSLMFWVALIGLFANLFSTVLLHKDSKKSINIKSAYLHLLSDTVSSVAVIIGAILIIYFKIFWVDSVLTFLIGLYVLKGCYSILMEAIHILMEGAPEGISIEDIKEELIKVNKVIDIHHVHIWSLSEHEIHFEAHVNIYDMNVSDTHKIRMKIEEILSHKFNIVHVTVQFEANCCDNLSLIHN